MPEIMIVAGPNGAGKTSFARQLLTILDSTYVFLNADEIARDLLSANMSDNERDLKAARRMLQRLDELTLASQNMVIETTLAALSYLKRIEAWKRDGFQVTLFFIRLPSPDAAIFRVRKRVAAGGHGIPEETVRRRFQLGLENLEKYYKSAVHTWYILDSTDGFFQLVESSIY